MSGGMQGGGGVPETLLSTKGQLHGYSTENIPVSVGTNNFSIYADSTEASGLVYGATAKSLLDATGKMLYASGANTLAAVSPGSLNDVLTMGGSSVPGWSAPAAGGGGNMEFVERFTKTSASSTFTCSLASAIDLTDFTTLIAIFKGRFDLSGTGMMELQIADNQQQPIAETRYSSMVMEVTTGVSVTKETDIDHWTVGVNTGGIGASTAGTIYMEVSIPPIVGAGDAGTLNPSNIYCRWMQNGKSEIQAWGAGYTYDNIAAVTDIRGFYLTNSEGNNFNTASIVDVYKVTR